MTRSGERRLIAALFAVAGGSIYAFTRVFSGRAWLLPALASAWGAIALARWLAHTPLPRAISATILAVTGAALVLIVAFPSATTYGLPGLTSLRAALSALRGAQAQISRVTAPIRPTPGDLVMSMAVAWAAGAISALVIGSPRESTAPAPGGVSRSFAAPAVWVAIFAVGAGIGRGAGRTADMAVFLASLLAYLLADRSRTAQRIPRFLGALGIGLLAMAGSLTLPNLVPGFRAGPLIPWARLSSQTETTVSPLVKIQPMLLSQPNTLLFNVTANAPAYWRLTSLDSFDGSTWSAQGTYRPGGGIDYSAGPQIPSATIRQSYRLAGLGGIWVPAAQLPIHVSGLHASVDKRTDTVITPGLQPGETYSVVSRDPAPTAAELIAAGDRPTPDAQDLQLPASTVAIIEPIVRGIVGNATTPYAQAVAIQDYLRTFTYSTAVPADSSTNYLYTFLTQTKTGYCEQFAGSMAVMLRILGIPARVAVGFLPGTPQALPASPAGLNPRPTTYAVTGEDAHAWPEAFFQGVGWVAFEPTPRPDAPAPPYAPGAGASPLATQPIPATPGASALGHASAAPTPATVPPPVPTPKRQPNRSQRVIESLVASLAVALLLLFAGREVALRLPGWLGRTPEQAVMAAWGEFLLRAADAAGTDGSRALGETEEEYAGRLVATLAVPARQAQALGLLTAAFQRSAYSATPPNPQEAASAVAAARDLRRVLWKRAQWRGRVALAFSPRPLRPHRRRR